MQICLFGTLSRENHATNFVHFWFTDIFDYGKANRRVFVTKISVKVCEIRNESYVSYTSYNSLTARQIFMIFVILDSSLSRIGH